MNTTEFKTISEIDWVKNIYTNTNDIKDLWEILWKNNDKKIIENIENYFNRFSNILNKEYPTLIEIEKFLQEIFWTSLIFADENEKVRLANALWWANTQIHRDAQKIILNWTQIPQHNMWKNIVDPIWWASRVAAPSWWYNNWNPEWYWILWKIPQLRPMDKNNFDKKIYNEIMNIKLKLWFMWFAIEKSKDEIAIMPLVKLEWWEEIIQNFSEEKQQKDIPTAKYYGINL